MKIFTAFALIILASGSLLIAEDWRPGIGYYENENEISAKDSLGSDRIFDFETSPNPGGEVIADGKYYVPIKYQGGYNGADTDYMYAEDLKGEDGTKGEKGEKGDRGKQGPAGKDADQGAVHDLQETKITGRIAIRVYDHKIFSISLYNTYDFRHSHNHELGAELTVKLGKSYEQKQIEKLQRQINILRDHMKYQLNSHIILVPDVKELK